MKRRISQDVWVLIVLGIILIIGSFFSVRRSSDTLKPDPRRTTYSYRPGGLKALYETLDKLGYPVKRHLEPLTTEPADGVLVIASPEVYITEDEWAALRAWVSRGNLAVLAMNDYLKDASQGGNEKPVPSRACAPSFLARGVRSFFTPEFSVLPDSWDLGKDQIFSRPFG